jgi:hypothetical protein
VHPVTLLFAVLLASTAIFLSVLCLKEPQSVIGLSRSHSVATSQPVEPQPPITTNNFFPEERDLTSCIGVLERPGCGSESRGGWRQTLILLAIFGGLTVVFGNIARGVIKNRRTQQQ